MTIKYTHDHKVRLLWLLLVATIGLGCACTPKSQLKKVRINDQAYYLKASMFAGDFYDNDAVTLIDHRPFSAIDDAKTLDGYTIFPNHADRIIKAGTLVKITDISFPTSSGQFIRPIFSPRDNIWVYFRVAKERGRVNLFDHEQHIMIIPKHIKSKKEVNEYLAQFLTEKDPNGWILSQRNFVTSGIFLKKPRVGMTKDQVLFALGPAAKVQESKTNSFGNEEIWHYHNYFIVMSEDKVKKIKRLDID